MVRLLLLLPLMLLTACADDPTLRVKSNDGRRALSQPFSLAAMSGSVERDFDIVLVAQGTEAAEPVAAGKELNPAPAPPIRQVVYLRLHWRPYPGAGPDNPASSNATVRWFLYPAAGAATATSDSVEYHGTAFVKPTFSRDGCELVVRAGELYPAKIKGRMRDAIGPSSFSGTFFAPYAEPTVAAVLKELPLEVPPAAIPAAADAAK
jgi:hypothetical protein